VSPAETAEQIDMPIGVWTLAGPKNHLIDRPTGSGPREKKGAIFLGGELFPSF